MHDGTARFGAFCFARVWALAFLGVGELLGSMWGASFSSVVVVVLLHIST